MIKDKDVKEKVLLFSIIGGLEALKKGAVTVDELEAFIFSPYVSDALREKGFNKKIISIIEEGCFLEDYLSLLPEKMPKEINKIKKKAIMQLRNYEECKQFNWLEEELGGRNWKRRSIKMNENLDKFGDIFIKEVRDKSIRIIDRSLQGKIKTESALKLAARVQCLSDDAQNVINDMIPDIVNVCLFNTLFMFEEHASDDIKLMVGTEDLNEISGGLAGELYSSDGWIEKYSKERYNKK